MILFCRARAHPVSPWLGLVRKFLVLVPSVFQAFFASFLQVRTVSKYQLELLREAVHDVSPSVSLISTRVMSLLVLLPLFFYWSGK